MCKICTDIWLENKKRMLKITWCLLKLLFKWDSFFGLAVLKIKSSYFNNRYSEKLQSKSSWWAGWE